MGILIALVIIVLWSANLFLSLAFVPVAFARPLFLVNMVVQAYLYTGLFITAHDAMHGIVARNRFVNDLIGWSSSLLFAGFFFSRLRPEHIKHHLHPGDQGDPDFHVSSQNPVKWFFAFFGHYVTIPQIVLQAVIFNLLLLAFPAPSIILFWIVPAFLATIQLFAFGTYLPHRRPHTDTMNPHNARTQNRNHLWAMLSCYFFGYHWEHHQWPRTPWWQLYKRKNEYLERAKGGSLE